METTFLKKIRATEHSTPWTYYLIEDFLPENAFKELQEYVQLSDQGFSVLPDDEFKVNYKFMPHLSFAKLMLSEEFKEFLEETTQTKLEINETNLIQLRLMTDKNPPMTPHTDYGDRRSLVCILYLSPNWQPQNGGELCLLESSDPLETDAVIVEPFANRMILFFSDEQNLHSVKKVKNWNRFSAISEWIVQEN